MTAVTLAPTRAGGAAAAGICFLAAPALGLAVGLEAVPPPLFMLCGLGVAAGLSRLLLRSESGAVKVAAWAVWVAVALAALNLYAPTNPSLQLRVLASGVILLGLVPSLMWNLARMHGVPLLPALGALYGLYFGAPVFLREDLVRTLRIGRRIPEPTMAWALWLALIGLMCLYLGFAVVSRWRRESGNALSQVAGRLVGHAGLAAGVAAGGVTLYGFELTVKPGPEVAQLVELASSAGLLGSLALYLAWARQRRRLWVALALLSILAIRLLMGFGTGMNFQAFSVLLSLLLLVSVVRRRLPWRLALCGLLLLALLQPVKFAFRGSSWTPIAANPLSNGLDYVSTAVDFANSQLNWRDSVDAFVQRLGYLMTFAEVIEQTPSSVPYWGGETLTPILTKPIPRVFWSAKPEEVTGQTFGHRYGFLDPGDTTTAYNMPQLVEFYANFGAWGVALGMFGIGLIYRLLLRIVEPISGDWLGALVAAYVLSPLLLIESATSSVLAVTLYRLAALAFLTVLIGYSGRRTSPRPNPTATSP